MLNVKKIELDTDTFAISLGIHSATYQPEHLWWIPLSKTVLAVLSR